MRAYIYQAALLCEDCGKAAEIALRPTMPAGFDVLDMYLGRES